MDHSIQGSGTYKQANSDLQVSELVFDTLSMFSSCYCQNVYRDRDVKLSISRIQDI